MKKATFSLSLILLAHVLFAQAWTPSSPNIYFTGGNVGIGTTTPGAALSVNGTTRLLSTVCIGSNSDGPGFFNLYFNAGSENQIGFNVNNQPTDQKIWSIIAQGSTFRILTEKDDFSAIGQALVMSRGTGTNVATTAFPMGNVLIGETSQVNPAYILDVNGSARATKVVVNTTGADFVFEPKYRLPSLSEVHQYILTHHHLPGIEPAQKMQEQGLDLGDNQTRLLQKIEELTLYTIRQDQRIEALEEEVKSLLKKN